MPTVLRIEGLRVVIYPNDYPPAHVHVIGPRWVVVINLRGPEARRVLRLIADHQRALMEAWRRYHG
jgi:hypothetical protein